MRNILKRVKGNPRTYAIDAAAAAITFWLVGYFLTKVTFGAEVEPYLTKAANIMGGLSMVIFSLIVVLFGFGTAKEKDKE